MREVKMPSGAILKVNPAPFAEAKALFKAVLKEMKGVELGASSQANVLKNTIISNFISEEVEKALEKCLARCTYDYGKGDLKIDETSFADPKNWEDYTEVCTEVINENVDPFVKALFGKLLNPPPTGSDTQK